MRGRREHPRSAPAPRRRRRIWRSVGVALLAVAVVLIAARLALPSYLRSYVNRTLDQSPMYDGRIGEIDVHLWRGAYAIDDMEIVKTTHSVPVPLFQARRVDFSLNWSALLRGQARGKMVMQQPRINFVHGPSPEETQTGVDEPWLEMIEELYPFRIDRADVHDGEIHFHAFHTEPRVNVYLSRVEGEVTNLTNIENKIDPLIATIKARGVAMESADADAGNGGANGETRSGHFELEMRLDPHSHRPNFTLATRLLDLEVTKLNALTRAYGDFDFAAGRFDFVVELATKDGLLNGYAKALFRDVEVLSLRDLEHDDPLQVFWEALVGIVGEVFKNQPRDQFGTRITLQGYLDNPRTNLLEIVGNVLRNAFVRAYLPRIEGRVAPLPVNPDDAD